MGFLHICKSAKEDGVFSNIFFKKVPNFYPMLEVQVTNINEKKYFPGIYQNFLHIFSNNSDW